MTTAGALRTRLFQPVDVASLALFRILFGAVLLWEVIRYSIPGEQGISWIRGIYMLPSMHFPYEGFGWVTAWSGNGMYFHFAALGVLAFLIMIGCWYRVAMLLFACGYTYVFLIDKTQFRNHYYLICILSFLMVFVAAHRTWSVDARRRPELRSGVVPAWMPWLLLAQLSIVYFYAGVAKLDSDWLTGTPMRLMLDARRGDALVGWLADSRTAALFLTYGGLFLDLLVAPALLWKRTRPFAFAAATGFHLTNAYLFPIGVFPWLMIAATTLFLEPSWPRRFVPRNADERHGSRGRDTDFAWTPLARGVAVLLALHLLIQVVVPLRSLAYSGYRTWTQEGHRFSWRMMLAHRWADPRFLWVRVTDVDQKKNFWVSPLTGMTAEEAAELLVDETAYRSFCQEVAGEFNQMGHRRVDMRREPVEQIQFIVRDPIRGREQRIRVLQHVSIAQMYELSCRPDMILQFAHYLAERQRDRGWEDVEVRAESWVSLNGRPFQPLVDSTVDLAAESWTWGGFDWVLPLEVPVPGPDDPILTPETVRE